MHYTTKKNCKYKNMPYHSEASLYQSVHGTDHAIVGGAASTRSPRGAIIVCNHPWQLRYIFVHHACLVRSVVVVAIINSSLPKSTCLSFDRGYLQEMVIYDLRHTTCHRVWSTWQPPLLHEIPTPTHPPVQRTPKSFSKLLIACPPSIRSKKSWAPTLSPDVSPHPMQGGRFSGCTPPKFARAFSSTTVRRVAASINVTALHLAHVRYPLL